MIVSIFLAGAALIAQPAQADAQTLAVALDRCMTSYAVRLTRTDAPDEDIYAQAVQGCSSLKGQLTGTVTAEFPAARASEILQALDAQARPNFMSMLARIRSDRAARAGG